jgi:hypothetical protein
LSRHELRARVSNWPRPCDQPGCAASADPRGLTEDQQTTAQIVDRHVFAVHPSHAGAPISTSTLPPPASGPGSAIGGDLETAEKAARRTATQAHKLQRDCENYPRDRRLAGDVIERITAELENRKAMKRPWSELAAVEDQQIASASTG